MVVLGFIIPFIFPMLFPGILLLPFYIWMVRDAALRPTLRGGAKVLWVSVNVLVPVLGNFIYFVAERPKHLPPAEVVEYAAVEDTQADGDASDGAGEDHQA